MLNLTKQELDENLNFKEGFVIRYISSKDLKNNKNNRKFALEKVLISNYPKNFNSTEFPEIYDYHKISDQINHKKLWPMKNRILSLSDYKKILSTDLFNTIKAFILTLKYQMKIILVMEKYTGEL